jgi:hypothetical protein
MHYNLIIYYEMNDWYTFTEASLLALEVMYML